MFRSIFTNAHALKTLSVLPCLMSLACFCHASLSHLQPEFKESSVYLARFNHCQSHALSLIKQHTLSTLREATQQVMPVPAVSVAISDCVVHCIIIIM